MSAFDQLLEEIFEEHAEAIGDDLPFAEARGFDSLKHAVLIVGLEQRYELELSRDEIARLTSKRAVREMLASRGHAG
jgi:acyl carrier protein